MQIEQKIWNKECGWKNVNSGASLDNAQLVLAFGATRFIKNPEFFEVIRSLYPQAYIFGCSTAGEIIGTRVVDDSIALTAINFEHTRVKGVHIKIDQADDSNQAGGILIQSIPREDLTHVLILCDGLTVNGSGLIKGLTDSLPRHVAVTGGLAGDGERFEETYIIANGPGERNMIAAIGLYGQRLQVGYGSRGGWDPFGPERLVTRSNKNILYEMDNRSALDLYKLYLGEHADGLPASALQFPLNLRSREADTPVVRAILGVNEAEGSLAFGGDIPEGTYVRLMKANIDRLIEGAITAAEFSKVISEPPELALLISCVARKKVLRQRTEEEVEGVQDILGAKTVLAGFYSYGEICPHSMDGESEFHNETMTITTFAEV